MLFQKYIDELGKQLWRWFFILNVSLWEESGYVSMVCEVSESDERKLAGVACNTLVDSCEILLCFLTLDFCYCKIFFLLYMWHRGTS